MNGSIRVSAKTVDDAITEALIQLGVTSDRLEYEVIEKGSAGFLGIGMKQAVIEARRKPEPKEEKVEEPVVEEPVRVEPKKVEAVQPQKAAAEKKADEPQKAAFEKAVEKEAKEEVTTHNRTHFLIDHMRSFIRHVFCFRHGTPQEHFPVIFSIKNRAKFIGETPLSHHVTSDISCYFNIVRSTCRNIFFAVNQIFC